MIDTASQWFLLVLGPSSISWWLMIHTVRVVSKSEQDSKGLDLLEEIKRTLKIKGINRIRTAKVYRLEGLNREKARKFTEEVLYEPIDQRATFNKPIFNRASQIIEIAYKPGVMNPEAGSLLKAGKDLGMKIAAADSSWEYAFFGKTTRDALNKITRRLLVNDVVECVVTFPPKTLLIKGTTPKVQKIPIRVLSDAQLMDLSKDKLFLNLEEMKIIQNYFKRIGRDPTDCEVEILAQTWSEHCVHKTFHAALVIDGKRKKPLMDRIKKTADYNKKLIISAFADNSGVIDFYDGWAVNGKVETHNSPSAIEPYGGAMTGSGGVFRDVLGTGKGAKVVASTDIFCFAPPNLAEKELPVGCLPPDYLLRKVVAGVRDYGNRVGIPTNNGSIHFHPDFRAKCTVGVGSYGLIPKKQAKKSWPKKGDLILAIGGRTGRDGIHGATFSSGEMTADTIDVSGSAVQIGNAIEEKRMIDATLALRDEGLIAAVTDCGAGGFSSAVGEMGQKIGAHVNLEKAPLKYSGLAPWEIFLSESQERMVLAIPPKKLKRALEICRLRNVEAMVIGEFDGEKRLKVVYKNQEVCNLSMDFLHHGLPQRTMIGHSRSEQKPEKPPKEPRDLGKIWKKIMAHGNVCSKEPIVRMYDHNVQGKCALHPFGGATFDGPNDGVIIKPLLTKPYGLVITHGLNPALNKIDPYWGSMWALIEAVSNFVALGGDIRTAALIDNFIWPFPDDESLADLDKAVDACADFARALCMSFISGKDSLSSTYRYPDGGILKIPPVLLISVFGKISDVTETATADFKLSDSIICLVGSPDLKNLGGSTYFDVMGGSSAELPKMNAKNLKKVFNHIHKGIKGSRILACHDISEGGLATALAEMCFGGGCGAEIDLLKISKDRFDYILFNETPGTFLAEVKDERTAKKLFAGIPHTVIGKTVPGGRIKVSKGSKNLVSLSVKELKKAWQKPMKEIFH